MYSDSTILPLVGHHTLRGGLKIFENFAEISHAVVEAGGYYPLCVRLCLQVSLVVHAMCCGEVTFDDPPIPLASQQLVQAKGALCSLPRRLAHRPEVSFFMRHEDYFTDPKGCVSNGCVDMHSVVDMHVPCRRQTGRIPAQ